MFEIQFLKKLKVNYPAVLFGCDEVGRGPLAGPVVAACVKVTAESDESLKELLKVLKKLSVTDSKALKAESRREILRKLGIDYQTLKPKMTYAIEQKDFKFTFALEEIDNYEIDRINILQASLMCMKNAFEQLVGEGEEALVLIDGNKTFKSEKLKSIHPIIKGDTKSLLIGLASIIAKEYRDSLMQKYHELYPHYGFSSNAGYPSIKHRESIKVFGPTAIHRLTFKGVKEYAGSKKFERTEA